MNKRCQWTHFLFHVDLGCQPYVIMDKCLLIKNLFSVTFMANRRWYSLLIFPLKKFCLKSASSKLLSFKMWQKLYSPSPMWSFWEESIAFFFFLIRVFLISGLWWWGVINPRTLGPQPWLAIMLCTSPVSFTSYFFSSPTFCYQKRNIRKYH